MRVKNEKRTVFPIVCKFTFVYKLTAKRATWWQQGHIGQSEGDARVIIIAGSKRNGAC